MPFRALDVLDDLSHRRSPDVKIRALFELLEVNFIAVPATSRPILTYKAKL